MRQFHGDVLVLDGFAQRLDIFFLVEDLAKRLGQLALQSLLRLASLFQPAPDAIDRWMKIEQFLSRIYTDRWIETF